MLDFKLETSELKLCDARKNWCSGVRWIHYFIDSTPWAMLDSRLNQLTMIRAL